MFLRNKHFLTIFAVIIFLLFLTDKFCFALEVPLPGNSEDLPNYIKTVFDLIIGIAGAIAVLAFIIGAIRYLTSAGSPEKMGEAKKTIFSAVVGLVLLLSSFLIMMTINPKLTELKVHEIKPITIAGVYLTGGDKRVPCPAAVFDSNELAPGLESVLIDCPTKEDGTEEERTYLLIKYTEPGLRGTNTTETLECGESGSIAKSFKVQRKWPGVYLYKDANCQNISSFTRLTGSVRRLGSITKQETNCLEIFNEGNEEYGFILFKNPDFKSERNDRDMNDANSARACRPEFIPNQYSIELQNYNSIAVFKFNPDPINAGTEVGFYSKAHYDEQSARLIIKNTQITEGYWVESASNMRFPSNSPEEEWNRCKDRDTNYEPSFAKCPGSIRIAGTYLVVVNSVDYGIVGDDHYYCQLFAWMNPEGETPPEGLHDVSNAALLEGEYLIAEGDNGASTVSIISAFSF